LAPPPIPAPSEVLDAVTSAFPSMVILPQGSASMPLPMPAAALPPVAITLALPPMVILPQLSRVSPPMPAP
jgi:hypothetical protein